MFHYLQIIFELDPEGLNLAANVCSLWRDVVVDNIMKNPVLRKRRVKLCKLTQNGCNSVHNNQYRNTLCIPDGKDLKNKLLSAVQNNCPEDLNKALSIMDVDVNFPLEEDDHQTALHQAVRLNHLDCAKVLISHPEVGKGSSF